MSRFNLLEEDWIAVMTDHKGTVKEVSLLDLFNNAQNYVGLAGDMPTQDFAVLRVLLAILHTVFSRFDAEGKPYPYIHLDKRYRQIEEVDEDDYVDYEDDLMLTWETLWQNGEFPSIVEEYLLKWKDRFYLFDETYPFYQVTEEEIRSHKIKALRGTNPTLTHLRKINREVSESGKPKDKNRIISLFSPKSETTKDTLSNSDLTRWMILYQGIVGTADKATYSEYEFTTSKGWLFSIGGISLEGKNLFESLLLNLVLLHSEEEHRFTKQKPCWEFSGLEVINKSLALQPIDNLSELYTNWSRALNILEDNNKDNSTIVQTVKLPEVNPQNQYLETMTLWKYNARGVYKNTRTPRKHDIKDYFWQSFGNIFIPSENEKNKRPGIIDWLYQINYLFNNHKIIIRAYGMDFDTNPNSREPVDEYHDALNMNEYVLMDVMEAGWVPRITNEVEKTKETIEITLGNFVREVKTIRSIEKNDFTNKILQEGYFSIDQPFREWLTSIEINEDKEEKVKEWRLELRDLMVAEADKLVETSGSRDYRGIINDRTEQFTNIAIAYNKFIYWLDQGLELNTRRDK